MKKLYIALFVALLVIFSNFSHASEESAEHDDEGLIELNREQLIAANIKTTELVESQLFDQILAFGELVNNEYESYLLASPVKGRVLERKSFLGQKVSKGDVLVSLYSEDVASLQSNFSVVSSEWNRVQRLGKATVGAKRFDNARIAYQTAKAKIDNLGIRFTDPSDLKKKKSIGVFYLSALADGVILKDDFTQGEIVSAGQVLLTMVNEETLWVDAQVTSNKLIPDNATAKVQVAERLLEAKIIQYGHAIDEVTRTRKVRLLIQNEDDSLHSGMFADVLFYIPVSKQGFLIDESAVMRTDDGDWGVFVEEKPNHFRLQEVELGISDGERIQIIGLEKSTKVVSQGAFFLQSEAQKSGFDIHGH